MMTTVFRRATPVAAIAIAFISAGCAAVKPVEITGCAGKMLSDGSTPVTARVKNYSSKPMSAMVISIMGYRDGLPVSGSSSITVRHSINPGMVADVKYGGKPVLVFLRPYFGPPAKRIVCEPMQVTFADGSVWTKPGPSL